MSAAEPGAQYPPGASLADILDQGDALLAPVRIPPVTRLAAELFIHDHAAGVADQRELTEALGLDASPAPRAFDSAARRAVPDGFRRGRQTGRRSG